MGAVKRLLAEDAALEMTGTTTWFSGKATCVPFINAYGIGSPGDWQMVPLRANGQLGAAAYHLGDGERYQPSLSSSWRRRRRTSNASPCSPKPHCSLALSCRRNSAARPGT